MPSATLSSVGYLRGAGVPYPLLPADRVEASLDASNSVQFDSADRRNADVRLHTGDEPKPWMTLATHAAAISTK
jgi:hypothetical protein